ncbi:MAG TPA: DUF3048 domain-containing protein [Candidatus Limnocylindria bacterium]|nr:DUF3048 domain-containing protein [Candidatus Limnocylindria bacterium]
MLSVANTVAVVLAMLLATVTSARPAAASTAAVTATCTASVGPGIPPPAVLPAGLPGFHATWYGQSGYMSLCPGDTSVATVAYYNTGSNGWVAGRAGQTAFLGTNGPEPGADQPSILGGDGTNGTPNTQWPRYNRVAAQPADYVGPGQVAWFQFTVKAPPTPGVYVVGLRPVIEGTQWMEDIGVYWVVWVKNPDGTVPLSSRPACTQCWPLNGLRNAPGQPNPQRRSLVVRIDDAPAARPHTGIAQADIVFETLVEAGITRYEAVFHSQDPAKIGSVRSARLSDREITPMVRGALAFSGATTEETKFIQEDAAAGKYIDLNANWSYSGAAYFRVTADDAGNPRVGPYNEYTTSNLLREATNRAGGGAPVTIPSWGFLDSVNHIDWAGGFYGSTFATNITIPYQHQNEVRYTYDGATRTYARYQYDPNYGRMVREVDALTNTPIAARNIIALYTDIVTTAIVEDSLGSLGVNVRTTGTGHMSIFRDGRRQDGTWYRGSVFDPWLFVSSSGEQILLSPGQTWVHMIPTTWSVPSN